MKVWSSELVLILHSASLIKFSLSSAILTTSIVKNDFGTILIWYNEQMHQELFRIKTPQIIASNLKQSQFFNLRILIIAYINETRMLSQLSKFLESHRQAKVLLESNLSVVEVLHDCNRLKMENVVLWNKNFYSFEPFSRPTKVFRIEPSLIFSSSFFKNYNDESLLVAIPSSLSTTECVFINCDFLRIYGEKYKVNLTYGSFKDIEKPDIVIAYFPTDNLSYIYPLERYTSGAIVPIKTETNVSKFFILPFQTSVWIACCISVIYFGLVFSLLSYRLKNRAEILTNIIKAFSIPFQPGAEAPQNHRIVLYIYTVIMVFEMYLTMLYTLYLGSFFVVPVEKSDFLIIYNKLIKYGLKTHHSDLLLDGRYKIHEVEAHVNRETYEQLNTSVGIFINGQQWKRDFSFQKNLDRKIFQTISPWKTTSSAVAPSISNNSIHKWRLDWLYLQTYSFGLSDEWIFRSQIHNLSQKVNSILAEERKDSTLFFTDLVLVFKIYGFGVGVSGFTYLFEIISYLLFK